MAKATVKPPGMSIPAYARRRGVSHTAVQKRIREGSLPNSAKIVNGRWRINAELADEEWEASTRPYQTPAQSGSAGAVAARTSGSAIAEATLRERRARAWLMELEIARKTRDLVPVREVEMVWANEIVEVRTAALGLPSRAKLRLPHLTPSDIGVLDALIREMLEGLSERPWRDPRGEPAPAAESHG